MVICFVTFGRFRAFRDIRPFPFGPGEGGPLSNMNVGMCRPSFFQQKKQKFKYGKKNPKCVFFGLLALGTLFLKYDLIFFKISGGMKNEI